MTSHKPLSRTLNDYYQKGLSALEKKNYEYAIEMFLQIVQEEPLFTDARKNLYKAEQEKNSAHPMSGISKVMAKMRACIPLLLAFFYESKKDYAKAIAFYEDLLRLDSTNRSYLKKIHLLAIKNEWPDVALVSLEALFTYDENNAAIAKKIGDLYYQKHDIENASRFYKKAMSLAPNDQTISKALKDLEALSTIKQGGWDQKGSYRDKIKDEERAQSLEKGTRLTTSESAMAIKIKELERSIVEKPNSVSLRLSLIDAYGEMNDLIGMERCVETSLQSFPTDESVLQRKMVCQKKKLENEVLRLQKEVVLHPGDQTIAEALSSAQKSLRTFECSLLEERVSRYPNDLTLKYELGVLYWSQERHDKAITEFQQAIKDPALAVRALHKMGLSFHAKGMYDLAVLQFTKALEKTPGMTEVGKEITYSLGITFEMMGKKSDAIAQFKKIYEIDISYKDIAQKIESFYA